MALKECKECGHQVSTKADKCPNCGVKNPTTGVLQKLVGVIILFVIIGWICSSLGDTGSDYSPEADKFSTLSLNVRGGPSTNFEVITALKPGEEVRVIDDSLGWHKIEMIERDGYKTGWASGKYLSDMSEYSEWESQNNNSSSQQTRSQSWKQDIDKVAAHVMIESFVEDRLKSPSTAEFPDAWDGYSYEDNIEYLGNQTYQINSYVDSENSFGAKIRTHFTGKIKQTGRDEWQLLSLSFKE